jgi:hypothetical protein
MSKEEIIDLAINLSRKLIAIKILKFHIEWLPTLAKQARIKKINNTIELFASDLNKTIDEDIFEVHNKIGILLRDLFEGKNFGYTQSEHWKITTKELKQGYIILDETNNNGDYLGIDHRYVLFLTNYKDSRFDIKKGNLSPFNSVKSILGNQRDLNDVNKVLNLMQIVKR